MNKSTKLKTIPVWKQPPSSLLNATTVSLLRSAGTRLTEQSLLTRRTQDQNWVGPGVPRKKLVGAQICTAACVPSQMSTNLSASPLLS